MFKLIKQEILNDFSKMVVGSSFYQHLLQQIDNKFLIRDEQLDILRRKINSADDLLGIVRASFKPVVLFKGSMRIEGMVYVDYSFAEKADDNLIINFQPNTTIKLTSMILLNGAYDIVICRIAHVDLIATCNGIFTSGVEIPIPLVDEISPANRIYIKLQARI